MSECLRFEEILRESDSAVAAEEMASHLEGCEACSSLLHDWNAISEAASQFEVPDESDGFRERVLDAVDRELAGIERERRWRPWLLSAAAALVMSLGLAVFWLQLDRPADPLDEWVIRSRALEDVEKSEQQYRLSIDRLASIVAETESSDSTPKLAALQEKLLLLDQAIAECEQQVEDNPYHAELRRQLLSVYREKDETLREVLEAKRQ